MILTAVVLYVLCMGLLTLYMLGGLVLLLIYLLRGRGAASPAPSLTAYPLVTVQLPLYNERYVVKRLLDAVAGLDYPRQRLTIQVLDDSTDDTSAIAAAQLRQMARAGFRVQHIRRDDRRGYKAGALKLGMEHAPADFYAIFDADFVPPPDFLSRTLPHLLADPRLGMAQGRWAHLNGDESPLTGGQTLAIDAHFLIEQSARCAGGLWSSFNGTGGVWRATCIREAGGWADTTLTEDLDLSYRAQLAGWRLLTLPDVVVPGELPTQMTAFKQQQGRWARGTTQCLRQHIGPAWGSRRGTLSQKLMATLHLCQYMPYPLLVLLTLLMPVLVAVGVMDDLSLQFTLLTGLVPPLMYAVSQSALYPAGWRRLRYFPALMLFGTGVALSNTLAMLSLLSGRQVGFQRTPKQGSQRAGAGYRAEVNYTLYGELLLALYSGWGAVVAWQTMPMAVPYLLWPALAYGLVGLLSLKEQRARRHRRRMTGTVQG